MDSKPEQSTKSRTTDADQVIRDYYESHPPSESEAFPDPLETVASGKSDDDVTELSGGDVDSSQQGISTGEETPGGSNPTPDQDLVDEIGKAAGVTYQDNEPLDFGEKEARRDDARWELNPASSEDYRERQASPEEGTSDPLASEGRKENGT